MIDRIAAGARGTAAAWTAVALLAGCTTSSFRYTDGRTATCTSQGCADTFTAPIDRKDGGTPANPGATPGADRHFHFTFDDDSTTEIPVSPNDYDLYQVGDRVAVHCVTGHLCTIGKAST